METPFADAVVALRSAQSADLLKQINALFLQIATCNAEGAIALWQTLDVVLLATDVIGPHRALVEKMQNAVVARMVAIAKAEDWGSHNPKRRTAFLAVIGQSHYQRFI